MSLQTTASSCHWVHSDGQGHQLQLNLRFRKCQWVFPMSKHKQPPLFLLPRASIPTIWPYHLASKRLFRPQHTVVTGCILIVKQGHQLQLNFRYWDCQWVFPMPKHKQPPLFLLPRALITTIWDYHLASKCLFRPQHLVEHWVYFDDQGHQLQLNLRFRKAQWVFPTPNHEKPPLFFLPRALIPTIWAYHLASKRLFRPQHPVVTGCILMVKATNCS